ncbi:MAG: hypothetical protein KC546_20550 [Anaerolineae bacterium]|nr:hypothetical protein [Anaerolineae bacterium]MCB0014765.1 hypothetical protein [Anaerolineales bacterium]
MLLNLDGADTARDEFLMVSEAAFGLVVAIIELAVRDATKGKPAHMVAAWEYFTGPAYREHLRWLGVSTFQYPDGLKL